MRAKDATVKRIFRRTTEPRFADSGTLTMIRPETETNEKEPHMRQEVRVTARPESLEEPGGGTRLRIDGGIFGLSGEAGLSQNMFPRG